MGGDVTFSEMQALRDEWKERADGWKAQAQAAAAAANAFQADLVAARETEKQMRADLAHKELEFRKLIPEHAAAVLGLKATCETEKKLREELATRPYKHELELVQREVHQRVIDMKTLRKDNEALREAADRMEKELTDAKETERQLRKRIDLDTRLLQNAVRPDVHEMIRQRAERFHAENVALQAKHARLVEAAEHLIYEIGESPAEMCCCDDPSCSHQQIWEDVCAHSGVLRAALSDTTPTEHHDTARLRVLREAANESLYRQNWNELRAALSDAPTSAREETLSAVRREREAVLRLLQDHEGRLTEPYTKGSHALQRAFKAIANGEHISDAPVPRRNP